MSDMDLDSDQSRGTLAFSDEKERLQDIGNITEKPISEQIKQGAIKKTFSYQKVGREFVRSDYLKPVRKLEKSEIPILSPTKSSKYKRANWDICSCCDNHNCTCIFSTDESDDNGDGTKEQPISNIIYPFKSLPKEEKYGIFKGFVDKIATNKNKIMVLKVDMGFEDHTDFSCYACTKTVRLWHELTPEQIYELYEAKGTTFISQKVFMDLNFLFANCEPCTEETPCSIFEWLKWTEGWNFYVRSDKFQTEKKVLDLLKAFAEKLSDRSKQENI